MSLVFNICFFGIRWIFIIFLQKIRKHKESRRIQ